MKNSEFIYIMKSLIDLSTGKPITISRLSRVIGVSKHLISKISLSQIPVSSNMEKNIICLGNGGWPTTFTTTFEYLSRGDIAQVFTKGDFSARIISSDDQLTCHHLRKLYEKHLNIYVDMSPQGR